jgi:hypothetical protein
LKEEEEEEEVFLLETDDFFNMIGFRKHLGYYIY